jgi:hypothetical protein
MHAGLIVAAIAAVQAIQNPVQVAGSVDGVRQTYSVDCWSRPQVRGTWMAIVGAAQTTQQALIYEPLAREARAVDTPSILYCVRTDGTAGVIDGAPPEFVLPLNSRVKSYPTLFIQPPDAPASQGIAYDEEMRIHDGPAGALLWKGAHQLFVYPPQTTMTFDGTPSYEYVRPGDPPATTDEGCAVAYVGSHGEISRTVHYAAPCSGVKLP